MPELVKKKKMGKNRLFLLTNDDGIDAVGLRKLAEMTVKLGEVVIVAPDSQCSAMSQRITLRTPFCLKKVDYGLKNVTAYSIGGTPADCVKVAFSYLNLKPDYVFSGMNYGINTGFDIAYSGTVSAAFESVMNHVPAIAFSNEMGDMYEVSEKYMLEITKKILAENPSYDSVYNVNFPGCSLEECSGILYDRKVAKVQYYLDSYGEDKNDEGCLKIFEKGIPQSKDIAEQGTDLRAVLDKYVSVGKVKCSVMCD